MNETLDEITWKECVKSVPITAIDLVFVRDKSHVLMGQRNNEPAMNSYFVPGGRVYKNETIKQAFDRICFIETKERFNFSNSKFLGFFEHFYDNSKWISCDISTHYIVLAFQINVDNKINFDLSNQHASLLWVDKHFHSDHFVHKYSENYLNLVL